MLPRTPRFLRNFRTPGRVFQQRCTPIRRYASSGEGRVPFEQLRTEMLSRGVTCHIDEISPGPSYKLAETLSGFLPDQWYSVLTKETPILPIGHHLVYFNPTESLDKLLPDGTVLLHSPGDPWVRRMWAGGSVHVRPDKYFHLNNGLKLRSTVTAAECIRDVQLIGKDQDAKIFVTIERRYARLDKLFQRHRKTPDGISPQVIFNQQLINNDEWGDALFKTEHKLVFLKEKTAAELQAIKSGQWSTPRYFARPGPPQFSHSFTPTSALLFRYSALTFNSHLIHLDRDYARNVEGHRNLLVHGPLSLTIMLQAISGYLATQTPEQQLNSIEYRNLAPLYCDEEMKVCGMEKKKFYDGALYDIWIEGPTGGVAVKGTVRSVNKTIKTEAPSPKLEVPELPTLSFGKKKTLKENTTKRETQQDSVRSQVPGTNAVETGRTEDLKSPVSSSEGAKTSDHFVNHPPETKEYRKFPRRFKSHEFVHLPESPVPIHRVDAPPKPFSPIMSSRSRELARRTGKNSSETSLDPVPLIRFHGATPYERTKSIVSNHSLFQHGGVRLIEGVKIRYEGQSITKLLEEEEAFASYDDAFSDESSK